MKDGLNNIQLEKSIEGELGVKGEEDKTEDEDTKISRKRKREVNTMGKREIETLDSKASLVSFSEIVEALKLRVEQDAKNLEVFEAQLEAMKNQVQCIELLRLRVELLEKEVMLLSEKIKTNEVNHSI